ncbi:mannose-6-phosphate isomerase, class I [uncultured Endozoicomonas sp.]|uniref:mannose-6-phosphate isomerase, class I n=1 Tax=uncultured Endozoicomonas sp. TaxID=432652 RepID=UPI0026220E0D|nr:mannose-6-phosphate isomerase, class I [uncultured Endozoicomonas sp.]
MSGIFSLQGCVQHYDWGGHQYLPELIKQPLDEQPWAELWLGAHPKAPSLINGNSLSVLISDNGETMLGKAVMENFATLPFLLKVLDVEKMLSIQVHPTLEQARAGYLREEQDGVPLDAPERNYRDMNHKPELMVALSDFWLLHGFRSVSSASQCLRQHPELIELADQLESQGMDAFYRKIMLHPDDILFNSMSRLAERLSSIGEPSRHSPDYWFLKAVTNANNQLDAGMISIYLMNLVFLQEGEGIFQDAQIPHAYLYGQNIEIMANSDNVLRAGLTPKHIDVPELLSVISTEAVEPLVLKGSPTREDDRLLFSAPVTDFSLEKVIVSESTAQHWRSRSQPMVLLVMDGVITINNDVTLGRGESAFVAANIALSIEFTGNCQIFVASSNLPEW